MLKKILIGAIAVQIVTILMIMQMTHLRPSVSWLRPTPSRTVLEPSTVGSTEKYIPFSTCGPYAQTLIDQKKLPVDAIASCDERSQKVNSETIWLTRVSYGPAQDCQSGCIYNHITAVMTADKTSAYDLPADSILTGIWGQPPLNEWREFGGFKCIQPLEAIASETKIHKQNNRYGWLFMFTEPFLCSYDEYEPLSESHGKIHTIGLALSGSVFVYLDADGTERWDTSRLRRARQEVSPLPTLPPAETGPGTYCASDADCYCRIFDGTKFLPGKTQRTCDSSKKTCKACLYF